MSYRGLDVPTAAQVQILLRPISSVGPGSALQIVYQSEVSFRTKKVRNFRFIMGSLKSSLTKFAKSIINGLVMRYMGQMSTQIVFFTLFSILLLSTLILISIRCARSRENVKGESQVSFTTEGYLTDRLSRFWPFYRHQNRPNRKSFSGNN